MEIVARFRICWRCAIILSFRRISFSVDGYCKREREIRFTQRGLVRLGCTVLPFANHQAANNSPRSDLCSTQTDNITTRSIPMHMINILGEFRPYIKPLIGLYMLLVWGSLMVSRRIVRPNFHNICIVHPIAPSFARFVWWCATHWWL